MDPILLPYTSDPYQIHLFPVSPNGHAFQCKFSLRYLPAPDIWIFSIGNALTGEEYVRQIPLICSYGALTDLLAPFQYLFSGDGLGCLYCFTKAEEADTVNPSENNLSQFHILWTDSDEISSLEDDDE